MVYLPDSKEFRAHRPDGSLIATIPSAGMGYLSPWTTAVTHHAVYYEDELGHLILRATPTGLN